MPWTDRLSATDREWVEALIHREVAAYAAEHPSDADGLRINATVKPHEDDQSGAIVAVEIRVEDRLPVFLLGLRKFQPERRTTQLWSADPRDGVAGA